MKQSTILKIFIIVCTLQSYIPLVYGNGIAAIDSGINDSHLFDYLIKAHMIQSMLKERRPETTLITIESPHFKPFASCVIENTLEEKTNHDLSVGLLKCYKQLCENNNIFYIEDILDALPNLIIGLHDLQTKAPRPLAFNPVAGQGICDLSAIDALLYAILTELSVCCNTITADFNGTFSALQDLKNTLTGCCNDILKDFQVTWTILGAGFNGTFSMANAIIIEITNCCAIVIADLSTIESELSVANSDATTILSSLNITLSSAAATVDLFGFLEETVTSCCETVDFINSLANCTDCILSCDRRDCASEC